ncbi:protein of unknown function [Candidatus Nitrosocosmicus franklandus]|uniref:Uncharacterized protein n=1 Tax=Candidatus Nitrosocosmicus franklandianus TaxID=1798806 RepID=A0A484I9D3_9ARCH|nr:protein of unknown function [Candidatus Nitrosocosmicus franklandus]
MMIFCNDGINLLKLNSMGPEILVFVNFVVKRNNNPLIFFVVNYANLNDSIFEQIGLDGI